MQFYLTKQASTLVILQFIKKHLIQHILFYASQTRHRVYRCLGMGLNHCIYCYIHIKFSVYTVYTQVLFHYGILNTHAHDATTCYILHIIFYYFFLFILDSLPDILADYMMSHTEAVCLTCALQYILQLNQMLSINLSEAMTSSGLYPISLKAQ